ncbi:hypothetical protein J437_LFUL019143 [Ladona fulva]|uniref:PiggyBac transposable element-derived protein domain-containing protein n=1 Tax=Ladona fulva TaxID=123851 RepID=A0A8K0KQ62_LADFU|nr:hypothetical protein J437_LFUL019143 [Ladona fulva]
MVKFKGRIFSSSVYHPSLLLNGVYTGKDSSIKQVGRLGSRVVQALTSGYENKEHHVLVDNFSCVDLFEALREKKFGTCGTVRSNSKGIPVKEKTKKEEPQKYW